MAINKTSILDLTMPNGGRYGVKDLQSAYSFCKSIALSHYENFPVGSILIPKSIRKHFYSVYAYSRIADDIGDELDASPEEKIEALNAYEALINYDYSTTELKNPIFFAIQHTNNIFSIPDIPYKRLLSAFRYDSAFHPFDQFSDLMKYCESSANPVGELILRLFGEYNEKTIVYSDAICSALQLVNFWQDISIDFKINRVYLPIENQKKNNIYPFDIKNINQQDFGNCLDELFLKTEHLFEEGKNILLLIGSKRLKAELKAIIAGGEIILKKCRLLNYRLIEERPKLWKSDLLKILLKGII